MIFEISLTHEIEGTVIISNPDGWMGTSANMSRHPDFKSIVESYKVSFRFYGDNGSENGFRDWILNIDKVYGPDSVILISVRISEDNGRNWFILFKGQLGLGALIEDIDDDYTVDIPFTQVAFWTNFINRYATPVNLKSTTDLDGNARIVNNELIAKLTSQTLKSSLKASSTVGILSGYFKTDGTFLQVGYDTVELDEIKDTIQFSDNLVLSTLYNFDIKYTGSYFFNIRKFLTRLGYATLPSAPTTPVIQIYGYYQVSVADLDYKYFVNVNGVDVATFTSVDHIIHDGGGLTPGPITFNNVAYTEFNYSDTLNLTKGDKVTIYGKRVSGTTDEVILYSPATTNTDSKTLFSLAGSVANSGALFDFPNGYTDNPYFEVLALTTFEQTDAAGFYIHDVADAICNRIIGVDNSVYSEYLGSPFTKARQYVQSGCGWAYMLFKGLQIRGYNLTDKPFYLSMKDWFEGAAPILNLGLGYGVVDGKDVIVIENKAKFYDDSDFSIKLSNVAKIKRYYDKDNQYSSVKFGYTDYKSEDIAGLDDTQTVTTWSSRFKMVGKPFVMLSTWIAASLLFEQARRTKRTKSEDYKFDDNNFVLAIRRAADGTITPELDEVFTNVTNLQSEATRYNKRLTPVRNLVRWLNVISAGLQNYTSSFFKFAGGEGNYDMAATMNSPCAGPFNGVNLSNKQDVQVSTDVINCANLYELEHKMTFQEYRTIQAKRHFALLISQTESDYNKCFIEDLNYTFETGALNLIVSAKTRFDLQVSEIINPDIEHPTCSVTTLPEDVFDGTFDGTFN